MTILKSFIIAVSMYSKFPVPQLEWKEKDMRYAICFFPVVGLMIGIVIMIWEMFCSRFNCNIVMRTFVAAVLPLLLTGGIHVDGFMDTSDALHSYQPKEKKLEILKDPHIGAFSVIRLCIYGAFYLAAVSELTGRVAVIWGMSFIISRCLSGLSVISFQNAKKEGSLYAFSSTAHKHVVMVSLIVELFFCMVVMWWFSPIFAIAAILPAVGMFTYYHYKSNREFGGITGDIAGWFLCMCELSIVIMLAIVHLINGI